MFLGSLIEGKRAVEYALDSVSLARLPPFQASLNPLSERGSSAGGSDVH